MQRKLIDQLDSFIKINTDVNPEVIDYFVIGAALQRRCQGLGIIPNLYCRLQSDTNFTNATRGLVENVGILEI